MTVLKKDLRLNASQEGRDVPIPFRLAEKAQRLIVSFSYAPVELSDERRAREKVGDCLLRAGFPPELRSDAVCESYLPLVNLVTLSLDAPDGYRGCAHRHDARQRLVFSKDEAAPGFEKGELMPGDWRLVLHPYAIVTDSCVCSVKIETEAAAG